MIFESETFRNEMQGIKSLIHIIPLFFKKKKTKTKMEVFEKSVMYLKPCINDFRIMAVETYNGELAFYL